MRGLGTLIAGILAAVVTVGLGLYLYNSDSVASYENVGTSERVNESAAEQEVEVEQDTPVELPEQEEREALFERTDQNVTLRIYDLSYEPRSGFAYIDALYFSVENRGVVSVRPDVVLFLFDENDEFSVRTFERARIPVSTLEPGGVFERTATVRIAANELDLPKTLRFVVEEAESSRTILTGDYVVNISQALST